MTLPLTLAPDHQIVHAHIAPETLWEMPVFLRDLVGQEPVCQITVGAHARVQIVDDNPQGERDVTLCIEDGAQVAYTVVMAGAEGLTDYTLRAQMVKSNGLFDFYGAAVLNGAAQARVTVLVDHRAPQTSSSQNIRSVLADESKMNFTGTVYVARTAQKTDAHQLSRAILLSPRAQMRVEPQLEIYADDVACAHGATCGALDEEVLFYLASRGLPADEARGLILQGFLSDVLSHVPEQTRAHVLTTLQEGK